MQEFEREVIERLVKIESEIKNNNEIKAIAITNQKDVIVLNQRLIKVEKALTNYQALLYSVTGGGIIAVITYIINNF